MSRVSKTAMSIKHWFSSQSAVQSLTNTTAKLRSRFTFELPEKYKGTILEKWSIYWKGLITDYKEVGRETAKDIRTRPLKALVIFSGLGFATYCVKKNPDEQSFRDQLLASTNDVLLLDSSIRNDETVRHVVSIESMQNAGLVRRLSVGVASFMWCDNYSSACGLYESQCSYLQPQYLKFFERVIDVGFLGKWWVLDGKMKNYDVNESEWKEQPE